MKGSDPIFEDTEIKARARASIVDAYSRYLSDVAALGAKPSLATFVQRYNAKQVNVPPEARRLIPSVHQATLRRWLKKTKRSGRGALKSQYSGGWTPLFDKHPEFREAVFEARRANPDASASELYHVLQQAFPDRRLPSQRTLERYLEARPNDV